MKLLVYISLVIVLTAPLVWAWKFIRAWLAPTVPLGTLLMRILGLSIAFIVYALLCLWMALYLMGQMEPS